MLLTLKRIDHNTDLTLNSRSETGAALRSEISEMYDFNPNVQLVYNGKVIEDNECLSQVFKNTNIVVILVKWKRPLEPGAFFIIIQRMAAKDPYFLSYLAMYPEKAQELFDKELSKATWPL
jgi:hypothetical protein